MNTVISDSVLGSFVIAHGLTESSELETKEAYSAMGLDRVRIETLLE